MGNCLRCDSAMVWAGDDNWIDVSQLQPNDKSAHNPEKHRLLAELRSYSASGASTSSFSTSTSSIGGDQVKIKISKKELEELVVKGGGNMQGLSSVEQLLTWVMINGRDGHDLYYDGRDEMNRQRPWRPVLQSIPEVN
ncbi:hypothetical protein ACFX12_037061 [Malus domestica]